MCCRVEDFQEGRELLGVFSAQGVRCCVHARVECLTAERNPRSTVFPHSGGKTRTRRARTMQTIKYFPVCEIAEQFRNIAARFPSKPDPCGVREAVGGGGERPERTRPDGAVAAIAGAGLAGGRGSKTFRYPNTTPSQVQPPIPIRGTHDTQVYPGELRRTPEASALPVGLW